MTVSPGLADRRVVAFESRRAAEMAALIRRHGGEAIVAPALREVPIPDNREALAHADDLESGAVDVVILLTGVGLRTLAQSLAPAWSAERLAAALGRVALVARGPKPVAALRALGLRPTVTVREPNTWREVLAALDDTLAVTGKRVAVHEYGVSNPALIDGLYTRGARVSRVPIYTWALPEDLAPLRAAIAALTAGAVDAALFTSATQVYHLFRVAQTDADAAASALAGAFRRIVVASIGPVCSAALRECGVEPDVEPPHPRMGQLVSELARRIGDLLPQKRTV